MRAPILQGYGGVNPSKQGLSYLSDEGATPEAFGAAIGRGLGQLGESLMEAGEQYEQRNAKTERFGALIGLSDFQLQAAEALTNLKQTVPPDIKDFPKQADAVYAPLEQKYLSSLPPRLQQEFTYRSRQIKQGIMADAFQFQYTQQNAFYREGIAKELERAKNAVFQTPAEYDKWDAHMAEVISESDLTPIEKMQVARETKGALTTVLYGKEVQEAKKGNVVLPKGTTPANVEGAYAGLVKRGLPQMQAAVLAGNIEQESGGRPEAWNKDEGALGIIQWRLDRLTKLKEFAARAGRAPADIDVQLDFLI
jgi:hypothetical protein